MAFSGCVMDQVYDLNTCSDTLCMGMHMHCMQNN